MSKHDISLSPATPSQSAKRHDGWSLPKQAAFLRALSATHSVTPDDPGELESLLGPTSAAAAFRAPPNCPSALTDDELIAALQEVETQEQK